MPGNTGWRETILQRPSRWLRPAGEAPPRTQAFMRVWRNWQTHQI
ncbi:hypothetical protein [Alicyclobacillus cellulosilyticus]|nr:hypothetical protein [Alicyclobacillus cellulosilyticus]